MARKVAAHIASRYSQLSPSGERAIVEALHSHYFPRQIWGQVSLSTEQWLATPEGREDLLDHTTRRLTSFRNKVIPWLDSAKPLAGARVLEIGCGTGASTVALAEQGASVTAIDIDDESLHVAKARCEAHNVSCELVKANGADAARILQADNFDFVIFFACLEHMTHSERMQAMQDTWNALQPGALWCVVETPNRLWFFDDHTAQLPFYHWLPDELAFAYSQFSPREPFRSSYRSFSSSSLEGFLRHGRGVSFHEFELTMGKAANLDVVSSLPLWWRSPGLLRDLARRYRRRFRLERMLASFQPDIHLGFFQPYLDLIIRKR